MDLTESMAVPREWHSATLLPDGTVLVAGGSNYRSNQVASAELYDPATGSWTAAATMVRARAQHIATLLLDGRVLVAGGYSNYGVLNSAEVYDPGSGR